MGKNTLDTLFSTVRREVLVALLLHSKKSWYLSELMWHLDRAASQLHRELTALTEIGLLIRRIEGRQTYFSANQGCPYVEELTMLLQKLAGLEALLKDALKSHATKIVSAYTLSVKSEGATEKRRLKLIVISNLTETVLMRAIGHVEGLLGQTITLELHRPKDLVGKGTDARELRRRLLLGKKHFIIGSKETIHALSESGTYRSKVHRRRR